jgi:hypothetical protein
MYIIFYTESRSFVVSNLMFFDNEFYRIRECITDWFLELSKVDVIYSEKVDKVRLKRNKNLPPYYYSGLWWHILSYGLLMAVIMTACLIFGARPETLLRVK